MLTYIINKKQLINLLNQLFDISNFEPNNTRTLVNLYNSNLPSYKLTITKTFTGKLVEVNNQILGSIIF
jgi:hypothetical protein